MKNKQTYIDRVIESALDAGFDRKQAEEIAQKSWEDYVEMVIDNFETSQAYS